MPRTIHRLSKGIGRLVLSLAILVVGATVLMVAWGIVNFRDEHWPTSRTVRVRGQAEQLLPPYPGSSFADVRITRGIDSPYSECVYYRTTHDPSRVVEYYRRLFEDRGWRHDVSRSGVWAREPAFSVSTYLMPDPPRYFSDGPAPGDEYSVVVCSPSFEQVLILMQAQTDP